ncbi:hypothetical protein FC40_GL001020 [Ligilactobacillus hayakitensis DSM 18933 = JCM 14209]|uniref:Integral membrane protein n=1 Tax=Ligilactobacillus hayakitensis DSM 18933 = JCM 14209 TaxID=1423755 RepID=A0A0R1WQ81_9LACO|nr:phage holin family protein [Ligilactobacillus hayakitensis]KRM18340.1 hypothetical protein FC40_GL001020 [Ligilactobacillus hayakitensis DSM 18933 = JCM 14209]
MLRYLIQRIIINTIMFLAIAGFFPMKFQVQNVLVAVIAAIVLSLLNIIVKPLLMIITMPITVATMGISMLFINALILELTSYILGGAFHFYSFGTALMVAIIMSVVNGILSIHASEKNS